MAKYKKGIPDSLNGLVGSVPGGSCKGMNIVNSRNKNQQKT